MINEAILYKIASQQKGKMNKEQMLHLIKLVKNNSDNNLILLKELLTLKSRLELLEEKNKKEREVVDVV